jgi:hypothetical protein
MSAAAAEPIRTAADLDLPANLASLGEGLPLETRAQLADALLRALDVARRTNDLGQLQRTVQRWELIRKMMLGPGWSQVVAWVESGAGRDQTPMTFEEFEARFPKRA